MKVYTEAELLAVVKRRARIPATASDGTADDDILDYMNEAIKTELIPFMVRLKEDYLVVTESIPLVSGQARYRLPTRAAGNKIREIKLRPADATSAEGDYDLDYVSREHIQRYNASGTDVSGFYMEDVDIILVPETAPMSGSLILSYFFRPSYLSTAYRQVLSVASNVVTLASAPPAGWGSSNTFDVHGPSSGAEIKASDAVGTIAGSDITFTLADIDGSTMGRKQVAANDYVALQGDCAIPQLPHELHPVVAQFAVVTILESQGDYEAASFHQRRLDKMLMGATELLQERIEGEPESIVNPGSIWFAGSGYGYSEGAW